MVGRDVDRARRQTAGPGGYAADGTTLPFMHHLDLSMPYSIMVDQLGERFCDEAGAYMEIGQRMYERQQRPARRCRAGW